ncbi:uncharacterized protein BYT42DRAFT_548465 [Radiomyces spectabilis]|uniref:uncharacterized protein n=1 Tax=Radiomyces spectabilis TaxID=64574 RepID=UPI00222112B0|nr:uncharacterized protein BYT42DRAFT_548465 [Radiomyces spectabilis]KAI8371630.1 hypothetical protein BYT42DRAFT_548465 [Radiomyces spectabilis]
MTSSSSTNTFDTNSTVLPENLSRKRKQEFECNKWSEFVYSSPNSPSAAIPCSTAAGLTEADHHGHLFNFDSIFPSFDHAVPPHDLSVSLPGHLQHSLYHSVTDFHHPPSQGTGSRRHSVAVGELDYHSLDVVKQEFNFASWDADIQQLLGTSMPSSWSSSSSGSTLDSVSLERPPVHRRAMSLRLETQPHDITMSSMASPTTPAFFTPSFLEALNEDDDKNSFAMSTDPSGNMSFLDGNHFPQPDIMDPSNDFLHHQHHPTQQSTNLCHPAVGTTITPSVISNPHSLSNWFLDEHHHSSPQQQQQQSLPPSSSHPSVKSKQRRTGKTKHHTSPPTSPSSTTISSSSSPSPPITPMQSSMQNLDALSFHQHQHHPSIPEEDEDMDNHASDKYSKASLVTARMAQGANSTSALKPIVQQYLLSSDPAGSGQRTVMILTSKVAQKSYGTEKRFLCPPPTTILKGANWWTRMNEAGGGHDDLSKAFFPTSLSPPKLTIHISGESTSQAGVLEWYTSSGSILDNSSSIIAASNTTASGDTTMSGKCVSKHLHINDADEKRKRVEVLVKIQLGNDVLLGTLPSKGIKVISKPSKKRQSLKNMELCIHHGTTISLFNRIRSQTVSTKYLGVSNSQGGSNAKSTGAGGGTCFVARTGCWDPFVIWIVDTSRSPDAANMTPRTHASTNPHYPPPPAIALQTNGQQPLAIHYNQSVVLQCVTTGLVSPVMVIRKVNKGSMVLGGNHMDNLSGSTGGECGDEALGDPVSQLHKVAFQIVQDPSIAHNNKANYNPLTAAASGLPLGEWTLPQSSQPATYLACLNDVVGMHKTTAPRTFLTSRPVPPSPAPPSSSSTPLDHMTTPTLASSWPDNDCLLSSEFMANELMCSVVSQEGNGKVVRKRRVSCDIAKPMSLPAKLQSQSKNNRRRVNSLNDVLPTKSEARRGSTASLDRRGSMNSETGQQNDGACWTEDVSDAAVWTIVGTDCAVYSFWTPPSGAGAFNAPFAASPEVSSPISPFPVVSNVTPAVGDASLSIGATLCVSGENMTRDLSVWFGDVRAPRTDYKCRESLICTLPSLQELINSPITVQEGMERKLPILLVRSDGVVYRTYKFYSF